jgi:ariadne-1
MDWEASNPNAAPTMMSATTTTTPRTAVQHHGKPKSGIRILTGTELEPELSGRVKELAEVLGLPPVPASVLLQEFRYSKERVLEEYMTDSDSVLKKCGVYHRVAAPLPFAIPVKMTRSQSATEVPCPICYDDMRGFDATQYMAMPCGHAFCSDCWKDFCHNAVMEGQSCVLTTCPQAGCKERVTEDEFQAALVAGGNDVMPSGAFKTGDDEAANAAMDDDSDRANYKNAYKKYKEFQLREFVEASPITRWCPGRGCDKVAAAASSAAMEAENSLATCTCGTEFCMVCGSEPHAPATCKDLAKWDEKCKNESETANWILANTKSCPKCVSRIEKNQGCNHMTCQKCRFEFCWICMGDWNNHGANTGGYYKCSRYRDGSEDPTSDVSKAKKELDRYLHFYRRYHAHHEAETFARKQLKETEQRMVALQEASDDLKWTDVEFLKAANVQLVDCRRVLKYTYVFGYYMADSDTPVRDRFEYHQEMLERFTEDLSELSEKPLDKMDRTEVVNKTRVVALFMKNVLKYVEEGMDEQYEAAPLNIK